MENSSFAISTSEKGRIVVDTGSERKKVVVIDDEETVITMVKSHLGQDYDVITANSGQEAIDLFSQGLIPDLVLLDLNMPEMNGWDTFAGIRAIGNKTPIAIYTTSEESEDKSRARELGAVDFIKKPARRAELLSRVGKLTG